MSVKTLQNYNTKFIDLNNLIKNQANLMSKCNIFIEKIFIIRFGNKYYI